MNRRRASSEALTAVPPILVAAIAALAIGCGGTREPRASAAAGTAAQDAATADIATPAETSVGRAAAAPAVSPIPSPAGDDSGEPGLASAGGRVYLSWLEHRGEAGPALRFAAWDGASWTPAGTIASGTVLSASWADPPSILAMADGTLVAHWSARAGDSPEATHVMISTSTDGGATWSPPGPPHDDLSPTEHGFVSLVDLGAGRFGVVWLDGRGYAKAGAARGETALMYAEYRKGSRHGETVLDPRVCDCCRTAAVVTPAGVVVAYRDRSHAEVRDISRVIVPVASRPAAPVTSAPPTQALAGVAPGPEARRPAGDSPAPAPVGHDGWTIDGCPVNGPALASSAQRVVAAWFTGESRTRKILAALSADGGATFGDPILLDDGHPAGRVAAEWLPDGRALVAWVGDRPGHAGILARVLDIDGRAGPSFEIAATATARAAGFPRLVRALDGLFVAWTDPTTPPRVRLARIGS